jgi:DNA repair protein RadA/Sms
MGKVSRLFVCATCERPSGQWSGRCAACGSWGTVSEHPAGSGGGSTRGPRRTSPVLTLVHGGEDHHIRTGSTGVDRILSGGLVRGSVVLLAGAPGIGKSTLLLQLASSLVGAGHPCLVASGEEAYAQVAARAQRLGIAREALTFTEGRDIHLVIGAALAERPEVLIVDSIHTVRDPGSDALPGGVSQVRACADALVGMAKESGIAVVLVGHVTKDGDLAGPRALEHAVDVVLTFEGEPRSGRRILAGGKNRFGPEGEVAWFEMGSGGLNEVDPGARLGEQEDEAGCATALVMAGRRAFAVGVQALVIPSQAPPRRHVTGLDLRRFSMVAAVVDRMSTLKLASAELYGATAGGLRVDDPGADLAVAAALASAESNTRPGPDTAFIGEVSLTGSLRHVDGMGARMAAARGAGIRTVLVPRTSLVAAATPGIRIVPVGHVREAVAWACALPSGAREVAALT